MSSRLAFVSLQNFNLSSVQGPLVATATVGANRAIIVNVRRHRTADALIGCGVEVPIGRIVRVRRVRPRRGRLIGFHRFGPLDPAREAFSRVCNLLQ